MNSIVVVADSMNPSVFNLDFDLRMVSFHVKRRDIRKNLCLRKSKLFSIYYKMYDQGTMLIIQNLKFPTTMFVIRYNEDS